MDISEGRPGRPGPLFAIGGAEDKVRERLILRTFVEACGGADAHVVVLATASELADTGERYADLFYQLHADSVEVLRLATREDALDAGPETLDVLEYATGLFMTGGNQLRITSALGGTAIAEAIHRRHRAGMVVAGTSAGAAVLSEYMISMGDSGGTPRRRLVQMAKGLGLAPHLVIDQHFRRRDRLGRLLTALSYNPGPLGLGIDEDTAAILEEDLDGHATLRVLGSGGVTVVDASGLRFTDSHAAQRDQPVAMLGLKLDFLTTGCRYDLARRAGIPPSRAEAGRESASGIADYEPVGSLT
jgi:cyanophycinase